MRVKLSDVTKYAKGTQINRDDLIENGQYIYLNGGINPSGRWNDANVKGNTVTISEGGNSSGYVNYMTEPFWCGAHCYYLFDGPKNTRYLYYALKSQQERLFSIRSGACMPNIKKADLGKFEFEFDRDERKQNKIVTVLSKIEAVIGERKRELELLDELVKSRFVEMFGNFVYECGRWNVCKIGDVADTIDPQPSHRTPPISPDGIPYVGITECNYRTRRIDFEKARKVGQNVLREHTERYTLDEGDFIIGKIGTIGKPFFIPAEQTYTLSANTVLIKPIKGKVVPQYLYAVFQSEYMERIIDAEKKSTSQPAFGIQKVRKIEIPMPPLELQQQFAAFVAQTDKSKLIIQKNLDELETLNKALMQKYFGGNEVR